jgi:hypothetical protein
MLELIDTKNGKTAVIFNDSGESIIRRTMGDINEKIN